MATKRHAKADPRSERPRSLCSWWPWVGAQVEYYGRAPVDGAKARKLGEPEDGAGGEGALEEGLTNADSADSDEAEVEEEEEGDEEDESYGGSRRGKKHLRQGAKKGGEASARARPRPLMEGTGNALRVLRFSKHQRNLFYHLFMRYWPRPTQQNLFYRPFMRYWPRPPCQRIVMNCPQGRITPA